MTMTAERPPRKAAPAALPSTLLPAWVDAAPLTPRERAVVQYVADFRAARKVGPTLQQVGDALGVSRVTVYEQVHAAARKGMLTIDRHKAGSLRLADPAAAAGSPEPARLRAENALLRALAAAAMSAIRGYAALYDGAARTGPRKAAVNGRTKMRRLAGQIDAALKAGGPGNGGGGG